MDHNPISADLLLGEPSTDVDALTQQVMRRDRRHIWIAAIACVIAWMLVVMLPWATVLPMLAKVAQTMRQTNDTSPASSSNELADIVHWATMVTFFTSIASMLLAAICTVALILLSRRATLRQINIRLRELSEQLRQIALKS